MNFIFINENNNLIDTTLYETEEQSLANKYIKSTDVVLELGARYGTVSCIINKKINNPKNQVSVEPDTRVHECLEKNMINNNCNFNIIKGFISNIPLELTNLDSYEGYGTTSIPSNASSIPRYTLEEIESMYNLKFNTLVADCEGFLEQFFDENPHLYQQLNLIIFETDYTDKCNYSKIIDNLKLNNFKNLHSGHNNVWSK